MSSGQPIAASSARALTYAAYTSFVPIGIATVLLGPMLPTLSARWSLNYSQAGALFTAQYVASTCAVMLSGWLASRWGFRFAIKTGLVLMSLGLALMLFGPKFAGILCIGAYGAGLGLAVPAANLLVADANPDRRSATLNLLNFFWSMGAVACPFLVAAAATSGHIPIFLGLVSAFSLVVAVGIAVMPASIVEPLATVAKGTTIDSQMRAILVLVRKNLAATFAVAALFFLYVGTENAFGGWVASYSKSLGSMAPATALMTPSFFYATMMVGRWLAPLLLRVVEETRLAQAGLVLACAGTAGLMLWHGVIGVIASACTAGLGFSCVYPITVSLLSRQFGDASTTIGSFMFVLSNIGGGLLPWIVGVASNRAGTIRAGLWFPFLGCAAMLLLYLRDWDRPAVDHALSTRESS